MAYYYTPLRYPGGKSKITDFVKQLFRQNNLCDGHYVEPYAGGAGVALALLMTEYASHIHLNDLNYPLYAFWHTVLHENDTLCRKIRDCKVSVPAWKRHRRVLDDPSNHDIADVGFSFFFLNRTNRSGIISGGVIGGFEQNGNWKIDARFNKQELIRRIQKIHDFRERISVYNLDAQELIKSVLPTIPKKSLIYLDPPYYVKGQRLYDNHYLHADHAKISDVVQRKIKQHWMVSYDNTPQICELYSQRRSVKYSLNYSAASAQVGSEAMFFSDSLKIPSEGGAEIGRLKLVA